MLVDAFHPELEGGDGAGVERLGEAIRECAADIER